MIRRVIFVLALVSAFAIRLPAQGGIDPEEGAVALNFTSPFRLKLTLGAVEPLMTQGDYGINGGAPDGHMSAETVNGVYRAFFTCWDGATEFSCMSETGTLALFSSLGGLYKNRTGTYFQTVLDGPIAGDPYESQYAGLNATWLDPNTGTIHGWYHAEVPVPGCQYSAYASIGYATSTDGGHHFTKQGMVVTSADQVVTGQCNVQGASLPEVVENGAYLYMLYDTLTPPDFAGGGIAIARAAKTSPRTWFKYYNGAFSQPGIAGLRTIIIPLGTGGQQAWAGSVIKSTTWNTFLMTHTDYNHEGSIYLRESSDLITWTGSVLLFANSSLHGYRHATLLGPVTDDTMGSSGYLYFGRQPLSGYIGPDTVLARRTFTIVR